MAGTGARKETPQRLRCTAHCSGILARASLGAGSCFGFPGTVACSESPLVLQSPQNTNCMFVIPCVNEANGLCSTGPAQGGVALIHAGKLCLAFRAIVVIRHGLSSIRRAPAAVSRVSSSQACGRGSSSQGRSRYTPPARIIV